MTQEPHRLKHALWRNSPHQDARPEAVELSLIIIHGISLPPGVWGGGAVDALFMGQLLGRKDLEAQGLGGLQQLRVSAHLWIRRSGAVLQYVPFNRRAWHAGVSRWRGREACNDFSIGIEMEGGDHIPYDERQYRVLSQVLAELKQRYPTLLEVVGHSDIAPGRKTDPGPSWDWSKLVLPEAMWLSGQQKGDGF